MNTFNLSVKTIALITAAILLVPFIAMQFSSEVNWGIFDFLIMGALVFCAGLAVKFITQKSTDWVYRVAVALSIGTTFILIWANLGVGLIGAGANLANLLYIGVIAVVVVGSIISKFKAAGMAKTMYFTAFSLVVLATIALITGMQNLPNSSVTEILGVNGFFAMLYLISAVLFRAVHQKQSNEK